jgi:hypothetical protein
VVLTYITIFLLCELELLISFGKIVLAPMMLRVMVEGTYKTRFYTKHIIQQTCIMISYSEGVCG